MNHPRPKVRLSRAVGIPLTRKCVKYFEKRPYPVPVHCDEQMVVEFYSR